MRSWCVLLAAILVSPALAEDDDFIRGYAAAVLQRDFEIKPEAVTVRNGVVQVRADLSEEERQRLTTAVMQIAGVQRVELIPVDTAPNLWTWLPSRQLFRPLIADPRWPRFSVAYQYYIDDSELSSVAALSFGESFALLQYDPGRGGTWQLGIQGAVFAIFDLASSSFDLINADYFAALPISYATGNFSGMFRILHQSSHLGDEFLLRNTEERINLSYEALDLLLSYETEFGLRGYGGGSYIFHVDPPDISPWALQAGLEYIGEPFGWAIPTRPVAAIDVQIHEEGHWTTNVSPTLGLQFGTGRGERRNLRVLLEYFNGNSPNGQFYDRHIQYIGLGCQLSL
jgi:hypothetical protein